MIDASGGFYLSLAKMTAISLNRAPLEDGCRCTQLTLRAKAKLKFCNSEKVNGSICSFVVLYLNYNAAITQYKINSFFKYKYRVSVILLSVALP